jgi:hypothetical protein
MTDRHAGYVVTLKDDIREDDAAHLIDLLGHLKGVLSVTPIVSDFSVAIAEERAYGQLREQVYVALNEVFTRKSG